MFFLCFSLLRANFTISPFLFLQKKPTGNEAERALAEALDKNTTLCKLSLVVKDAGARGTIDRVLTRNTELARTKKK